ncbi:alcohol dehydrogenase catalytic domain-containing protein [Thermoleophilia bacterium SCSIO 60948]|nr:alcohol dehydrogenase catalytic domain-containing protein [Thermoleophilia bacterium SCSIO 60948]
MANYTAVQVAEKGGELEVVERELREPGRGEVRIAVEACGVCHSDSMTKEGLFPGIEYPRVPGHEVAGRVDAVGDGVEGFAEGDRVGVGWFGGSCMRCDPCRSGDRIDCENLQVSGISYDGGYAESMIAPADALARIPDDLGAADAAPLLCAGVTTYNALRSSGARGGDLVAILGVGGLGHLGVQFASKLGFETVAIARGQDKRDMALELGADHYIDSTSEDVGERLTALGGAKVILATVTSSEAMAAAIPGLGTRGRLVIVGASAEPIEVSPISLIMGSKTILGHASGDSKDSEDTLDFAALEKVAPTIETVPLADAADAYKRMIEGDARFRMVLTM